MVILLPRLPLCHGQDGTNSMLTRHSPQESTWVSSCFTSTKSANQTLITGIYMGVFLFYERPETLVPVAEGICKLNGVLWSFTAFTTPTLLCLASAIRFMAIYMPYNYKDRVNIKNTSIGNM